MELEMKKNVRDLVAGHCVEMYVVVRLGCCTVELSLSCRRGVLDSAKTTWCTGRGFGV
jgi:hypothetical protein